MGFSLLGSWRKAWSIDFRSWWTSHDFQLLKILIERRECLRKSIWHINVDSLVLFFFYSWTFYFSFSICLDGIFTLSWARRIIVLLFTFITWFWHFIFMKLQGNKVSSFVENGVHVYIRCFVSAVRYTLGLNNQFYIIFA